MPTNDSVAAAKFAPILQDTIEVLRHTDPYHLTYWDLLAQNKTGREICLALGVCEEVLEMHLERFTAQLPDLFKLKKEQYGQVISTALLKAVRMGRLPGEPVIRQRVVETAQKLNVVKSQEAGSTIEHDASQVFVLPNYVKVPPLGDITKNIDGMRKSTKKFLHGYIDFDSLPTKSSVAKKMKISESKLSNKISVLYKETNLLTHPSLRCSKKWPEYRFSLLKKAYASSEAFRELADDVPNI